MPQTAGVSSTLAFFSAGCTTRAEQGTQHHQSKEEGDALAQQRWSERDQGSTYLARSVTEPRSTLALLLLFLLEPVGPDQGGQLKISAFLIAHMLGEENRRETYRFCNSGSAATAAAGSAAASPAETLPAF